MINFMDVIVLASYIWLCCSCVCFLKIVTRRPPRQLLTSVHDGNISPHDSHCPPSHLFLLSKFRDNIASPLKRLSAVRLPAALSQSSFSMLGLYFASWCLPIRTLLYTTGLCFPASLFLLLFSLLRCKKVASRHLLLDSVSSSSSPEHLGSWFYLLLGP